MLPPETTFADTHTFSSERGTGGQCSNFLIIGAMTDFDRPFRLPGVPPTANEGSQF